MNYTRISDSNRRYSSNDFESFKSNCSLQSPNNGNISEEKATIPQSMLSSETWRLIQVFMAEAIGTAMLMYFGCMGLIQGFGQGPIGGLQSGLMFGFTVAGIIVIFGHISNAHLNPAITVAALVLKVINPVKAIVYVIAQFGGACIGYALLKFVTPCEIFEYGVNENSGLCTTVPHQSISITQALLSEFIATCLLIYMVCGVWDPRCSHNTDSNPIKFGLLITLLSTVVGPYTGCSLNPARSFAPAVFNNVWTHHWIYWVGPLSAAVFGAISYKNIFLMEGHPVPNEIDSDHIKSINSDPPMVITQTSTASIPSTVNKRGNNDYIVKPFPK